MIKHYTVTQEEKQNQLAEHRTNMTPRSCKCGWHGFEKDLEFFGHDDFCCPKCNQELSPNGVI